MLSDAASDTGGTGLPFPPGDKMGLLTPLALGDAIGVIAGEEDAEDDASSNGKNAKFRALIVGGGGGIDVMDNRGGVSGGEGIWCTLFMSLNCGGWETEFCCCCCC